MQQTLRRDFQKHFLEIFNCTRKEDTTHPRLSTENNQRQEILVKPIDFLKEKEKENKILWASEQKEQGTYQRKRRRGDGGRPRGEERQAPQRPCAASGFQLGLQPRWTAASGQAFPRGQRGAVDGTPGAAIGRHRRATRAGAL